MNPVTALSLLLVRMGLFLQCWIILRLLNTIVLYKTITLKRTAKLTSLHPKRTSWRCKAPLLFVDSSPRASSLLLMAFCFLYLTSGSWRRKLHVRGNPFCHEVMAATIQVLQFRQSGIFIYYDRKVYKLFTIILTFSYATFKIESPNLASHVPLHINTSCIWHDGVY